MQGSKQIRYTVAIAAGKGGVGKSTLTAQLAYALQRMGLAVGVLDSDLYGPSQQKMFREERPMQQIDNKIFPAKSKNISVLSLAHFRSPNESTAVRAPIANNIISHFLQNTVWDPLDFLLIDFPPGTGDIQLTLSQKADISGAIAITTPQEIALMDVRKALHLFEQVQIPLLGIVENMSYYSLPIEGGSKEIRTYPFGRGGGERLANEKNVPLLGQIPLEDNLSLFSDTGRSLFEDPIASKSPAAITFETIAKNLISQLAILEQKPKMQIAKLNIQAGNLVEISWNDGLIQKISLETIQNSCPCAGCASKTERKMVGESGTVINQIAPVGRYALRISFSSGCSAGIYSFELLRSLQQLGVEKS